MAKSRLAIVSFILALIQILFLLFIFYIAALLPDYIIKQYFRIMLFISLLTIVLAVISLVSIKKNNLKGKSFAIIALVISGLLDIPIFIGLLRLSGIL